MPMIAITTRSSIRVKPRKNASRSRGKAFCFVLNIKLFFYFLSPPQKRMCTQEEEYINRFLVIISRILTINYLALMLINKFALEFIFIKQD
jgi:hypothetical protein